MQLYVTCEKLKAKVFDKPCSLVTLVIFESQINRHDFVTNGTPYVAREGWKCTHELIVNVLSSLNNHRRHSNPYQLLEYCE